MEPSKLNQTYIPKELLKKTSLSNKTSQLGRTFNKQENEKIGGDQNIQFDPIEIKFNGYELNKAQTLSIRIINKSPIPQRINILPPTEPSFTIKNNKKGSIAPGMAEIVQVQFISDVYKYQYDVIKVNTETDYFVIPIYAYPSIPNIENIFPKIVDFGTVNVNESSSNIYPIANQVPIDFQYEFIYLQESSAFIITPIKGTISSSSTENIEITFIPSDKKTFTADLEFVIKQFDFKPIKIKLMGTGRDKERRESLNSSRRVKSSKLNPLASKVETKTPNEFVAEINNGRNGELNTNTKTSFIRSKTSFPKLLKKTTNMNNTIGTEKEKGEVSAKKEAERDYLGYYSKIEEVDKEKDIKFSQFLGDRAMTQEELEYETKIIEETKKAHVQVLKEICLNRFQSQKNNNGEVDLTKMVERNVTWDSNRNDELKARREKLYLFMQAGSKIIRKYRLVKRLAKIREFLSDCKSKEDVRKKVDEDYAKSMDASKQNSKLSITKLTFSEDMLEGKSFPIVFNDETQATSKNFETSGSTTFDDYQPLNEIEKHEVEVISYTPLVLPNDFIYMTKRIPKARQSAEEEYPLKTSTLPEYSLITPSSIYNLPLKVPTHTFIYDSFSKSRFKTAEIVDEKDAEYLIDATLSHIEDEFEGWSTGDMDVLKTKFQRNMGCEFSTISAYNYPQYGDFGFLGELASHLPKEIQNLGVTKDDVIDEGDSDEEGLNQIEVNNSESLITKIEANSKAKERRADKSMRNFEGELMSVIDKNLETVKLKSIGEGITKIGSLNKWVGDRQNRILI